MSKKELISVIVPVYNIEVYLPRCIETIARQTYRNLEIILVDDGSTDGSGAICDEYVKTDERAIVIHQENQGLWAARNTGQKVAHGQYLMHVDGDDYLHVDAIKAMYEAINQNGSYDMAMIDLKFTERLDEDIESYTFNVNENENQITELTQEDLISNIFTHLDRVLFVYQWNKLYRRELVENIWCRKYMRSQDLDFNLRVYMKVNRVVWIHRPLYFYVQRPTSLVKAADAWDIYYHCRIDIFYQNLINLPADKQQYAHFLLEDLYGMMACLKDFHRNSPKRKDIGRFCRRYEQATFRAYWHNPDIRFVKKIAKTMQLHCSIVNWCILKSKSIIS